MRRGAFPAPGFLVLVAVIVGVFWLRTHHHHVSTSAARASARIGCASANVAYRNHRTGVWLTMSGTVSAVLPDSAGRLRHQRFVVRCSDRQTVLVVNDITVGARVPVRAGRPLAAHGQYIWNAAGGLLHYTHDGTNNLPAGWILYDGRVYE